MLPFAHLLPPIRSVPWGRGSFILGAAGPMHQATAPAKGRVSRYFCLSLFLVLGIEPLLAKQACYHSSHPQPRCVSSRTLTHIWVGTTQTSPIPRPGMTQPQAPQILVSNGLSEHHPGSEVTAGEKELSQKVWASAVSLPGPQGASGKELSGSRNMAE
jgi:hypothetical protein